MSSICRFSIIVPVYNGSESIDRCLSSLTQQYFDDFEIIVIDDGSQDDSAEKIKCWQRKSEKIRCIFRANGGVSSARNIGINIATGEFLIFVDSDDWVESGYLNDIDAFLSKHDVDCLILDYYVDQPSRPPLQSGFSNELPTAFDKERFRSFFSKGIINNCVWDKVIKRSLFRDFQIKFPEEISLGEDAVVVAKIGKYANGFGVLNSAYLHYVENSGSLSRKVTTALVWSQVCAAESKITETLFSESREGSEALRARFSFLFYYFMTLPGGTERIDTARFRETVKRLNWNWGEGVKFNLKVLLAKVSLLPIFGYFVRACYCRLSRRF